MLKLFGRNKGKSAPTDERNAVACAHPVSQQILRYNDPGQPNKVTAITCGQCGETILLQE